ncbi:MAG: alkaline phosphatase family protein [Chitinophagaceae bacterium]
MKKTTLYATAGRMRSFCVFCLISLLLPVISSAQPARIIVIGLDGLSVDGYKTAKHPNIDKLLEKGVLSLTTRPVMPSVTLPNWTSHFTASGPEEHGVTNNTWTVSQHSLQPLQTDDSGYYPSIFKLAKDKVLNVKTAFYYNWPELINAFNKNYFDRLLFQQNDGFDSLYNDAFDFIKANRQFPELIFLYSVHTDHAGHTYKWMSPQYISAIEKADTAIGVLMDRLKSEKLFDDTHFLLITDHGGHATTGHGGTSMDEMQVPWAVTGPRIRNAGLVDFFNSNKNTAIVIAKLLGIRDRDLPICWTGQLPDGMLK